MDGGVGIVGLGWGCRHPVRGGWVWVSEARFSVDECVGLGSPRDFCLFSSLDSRPLRPRRSQLTSAVSPARYYLLTPG